MSLEEILLQLYTTTTMRGSKVTKKIFKKVFINTTIVTSRLVFEVINFPKISCQKVSKVVTMEVSKVTINIFLKVSLDPTKVPFIVMYVDHTISISYKISKFK